MFTSRSRARSRLARQLSWLVVLSLSAAALFAPGVSSVAAASVAPVFIGGTLGANPTCGDLDNTLGGGQTWLELEKIDGNPAVGTYGEITITAVTGQTFSWTSTVGVDAVLVKAGSDNHAVYVYAPTAGSAESFGDTDLTHGPNQQGTSHVTFCYDVSNPSPTPTPTPVVTPTPTPVVTPTPTPVVTPTPTPVATPTPTPVATPTPTPIVTPTPTPIVTPTPTPIVTPTPTPVVTPEPTPVVTPEPTPVVTPTPTPVVTPEPTPVVTPEPTPLPTEEPNGASILIAKVDNNGTADPDDDVFLDGASFALYLDDGDAIFEAGEDALVFGPAPTVDSMIDTDILLPGEYWIVEAVVPAGFIGTDPILVELNTDPTITCFWDRTGFQGCDENEGDVEGLSWTIVIVDNTPIEATVAPTGGVGGATGRPAITLPPTDTLGTTTSAPASDTWRVILLAMAGLMGAALVLTPTRAVRKDDSEG